MTFIDEGVFQSVSCREQMHDSNSHSRNQPLGGKCMRERGEKCVRVERERGEGGKDGGRETGREEVGGVARDGERK